MRKVRFAADEGENLVALATVLSLTVPWAFRCRKMSPR